MFRALFLIAARLFNWFTDQGWYSGLSTHLESRPPTSLKLFVVLHHRTQRVVDIGHDLAVGWNPLDTSVYVYATAVDTKTNERSRLLLLFQ